MSVRHAVQYVLCLRGHATFGLWWVSGLSDRSWKRLETVWNNLIRMALHEKCPKKLRVDKAQEFTGLPGLKQFFEYLVHLRTVKIENPNWVKTDRFTLSFVELTEMRNVEVEIDPDRRASKRDKVKEKTVEVLLAEKTERLRKKLGNVKMFTFYCAEKYNWTETDYTLEKQDLRDKYDISKKPIPEHIINFTKEELRIELLRILRSQYET